MNHRLGSHMGSVPALIALGALAALGASCGGNSNSQVDQGSNQGNGGGSTTGTASSGGGTSSGSAASGSGGGGSASGSVSSGSGAGGSGNSGTGTGGSTSSGATVSSGSSAGACPQVASLVEAAHVTLAVTWPGTTSTSQGSGTVDIWILANLTVAGSAPNLMLGGKAQTCGTTLPPIALNGAGTLVAGGSKVQITFPAAVWTAPSMPKFDIQATASGWDSGSMLIFKPVLAPIGAAMPDPAAAWPTSAWSFPAGTQIVDADGDGKPGFTAVPLTGNGVVLPPTGLGLFGSAPSADKLYIVAKNNLSLNGTRTSCTDASGTANVTEFDNHVVGCHVRNGADCTTGMPNTQADFVDTSRTVYVPGTATFKAKQLPATATCADVLSALP